MSRKSHGATYSGGRSFTMSQRAWDRAKLAQISFRASAYSAGMRDAAQGRPMQINRCPAYRAGYDALERPA